MSKVQKLVAKWRLLPILSLLLLAMILAACGAQTPSLDVPAVDPDTEEAADAPAADTSAGESSSAETEAAAPADLSAMEAPMLAEMVASGDLPPLEERLPATPYEVTPPEEPGVYGGIWDAAVTGQADMNGFISYSH